MALVKLRVHVLNQGDFSRAQKAAAEENTKVSELSGRHSPEFRLKLTSAGSELIQSFSSEAKRRYESVMNVSSTLIGLYDDDLYYLSPEDSVESLVQSNDICYLVVKDIKKQGAGSKRQHNSSSSPGVPSVETVSATPELKTPYLNTSSQNKSSEIISTQDSSLIASQGSNSQVSGTPQKTAGIASSTPSSQHLFDSSAAQSENRDSIIPTPKRSKGSQPRETAPKEPTKVQSNGELPPSNSANAQSDVSSSSTPKKTTRRTRAQQKDQQKDQQTADAKKPETSKTDTSKPAVPETQKGPKSRRQEPKQDSKNTNSTKAQESKTQELLGVGRATHDLDVDKTGTSTQQLNAASHQGDAQKGKTVQKKSNPNEKQKVGAVDNSQSGKGATSRNNGTGNESVVPTSSEGNSSVPSSVTPSPSDDHGEKEHHGSSQTESEDDVGDNDDSEDDEEEEESRRRRRSHRAQVVSASRSVSNTSQTSQVTKPLPVRATHQSTQKEASPLPVVVPKQRSTNGDTGTSLPAAEKQKRGETRKEKETKEEKSKEEKPAEHDSVPGLGGFAALSKVRPAVHDGKEKRPQRYEVLEETQSSDEELESEESSSSDDDANDDSSDSDDDANSSRRRRGGALSALRRG